MNVHPSTRHAARILGAVAALLALEGCSNCCPSRPVCGGPCVRPASPVVVLEGRPAGPVDPKVMPAPDSTKSPKRTAADNPKGGEFQLDNGTFAIFRIVGGATESSPVGCVHSTLVNGERREYWAFRSDYDPPTCQPPLSPLENGLSIRCTAQSRSAQTYTQFVAFAASMNATIFFRTIQEDLAQLPQNP